MADIVLKGITWNHSRGITPLQAAAQRFTEMNPGIEIVWHKRTLQQFADFPIEKLTEEYDLLVIDHPWVGTAAKKGCVVAFDEYLPESFLRDQRENSVGSSHISYFYNDHQWALAIDAAAPAASYRKDLLKAAQVAVPQTWNEVLDLARQGKVAVPAIPIDLLMNFYTFCIAHGNMPFSTAERVIDDATGVAALHTMYELYAVVDRAMFEKNPINVAEALSCSDDYWYCPFAYGYSNYSRAGYGKNVVSYTDVVSYGGKKLKTTIGGTGLSVSSFSTYKAEAVAYAAMVASPEFQIHAYTANEGQPGYGKAWTSDFNNRLTNDFFSNVLPVMENAYLRPRYHGYLHFQDEAGRYIHDFLSGQHQNPGLVLQQLNEVYNQSLRINSKLPA